MIKDRFFEIYKKYNVFMHCVMEFVIRDIGFTMLPFAIVLLTNIVFLKKSFESVIASSDFMFAVVIISASYVIDFTGFNVNVKRRTNNLLFLGLNLAVLLLIFNVMFLVIVILKDNNFITNLDENQILFVSVGLFFITTVLKFLVFYEYLSSSIFQSQKYYFSKKPNQFISELNNQIEYINRKILSIKYDVENVKTKKNNLISRDFTTTRISVESKIDQTEQEIEKSIQELSKIKKQLSERKEEILENCT